MIWSTKITKNHEGHNVVALCKLCVHCGPLEERKISCRFALMKQIDSAFSEVN